MSDKVSLIIPCYNGEKYLATCFSCILQQTYRDVEVIIVNDGSIDRSDEIINRNIPVLRNKGYTVKYLFQKNQGAAAATNYALKYVEGDYIMLYDVDDILMPEAIEAKAVYLKNHPEYGMVRNNGYYVKSSKINSNAYLFVRKKREKRAEWIFDDILYGKTNNWSASFMVRSQMLFKVLKGREIYISQYGQNMQLMLPVSYYYRSGFIDMPLMRYVDFGESHSRTFDKSRQLELLNGFESNRIGIIKMMNLSKGEQENYINRIQEFYVHVRLNLARQSGDKELLKNQYSALKQNGGLKTKDRIVYLCGQYTYINWLYEKIRFFAGGLHAVYYKVEGAIIRK